MAIKHRAHMHNHFCVSIWISVHFFWHRKSWCAEWEIKKASLRGLGRKKKKALWCNLISCWFGLSTVGCARAASLKWNQSCRARSANLLLCLIHQVCQVAAMTSPFSFCSRESEGRHCHDTMFFFALPALKFHLVRGSDNKGAGVNFLDLPSTQPARGAFETNLMKKRRLLSSRRDVRRD